MAKRKKHTKKKVQKNLPKEPNMFMRGVFAVLLFVAGFFLLLGGFGQGGALPKGLFNAGYSAVGGAAYLLPIAFAMWGYYKFKKHSRTKNPKPLGNRRRRRSTSAS